jgi:hypothetical protein
VGCQNDALSSVGVAAEWWQKPVLPEEDLPEGEPLALREGWSGETRDQRLSSLATGVHLAPGDLTHQNRCILRAVATQTTAQQGASLIGPPPTSLNGELPPDFLLLVTCLWIEHLERGFGSD